MAGSIVVTINNTANGSARKFLKTWLSTGRPRQEQQEGGGHRRPPLFDCDLELDQEP